MGRPKRRRLTVQPPSATTKDRTNPPTRRPTRTWFGALLLVCIAVFYTPSLTNGFTSDDPDVIAESSNLLSHPSLIGGVFSADYFRLSNESTYRPVVTLTYILDWQIGGGASWMFHLQSVLWHLVAVGCVLVLLKRLGASEPLRYVSALLYGVHPALTEAVDAAAFREDVLVTAFGLVGLLLMTGDWPRRRIWRVSLAAIAFAAACLSKESGVVFVLLVPLTDWAMTQRAQGDGWKLRHHAIEYLFAALCVLAFIVVRFALLPSPSHENYGSRIGDSLTMSLATGVVAVGYYLRLLVWPYPLCPDYRGVVAVVTTVADWRVWISALVIAGISTAAWRWRRRQPLLLWGWAWFLIAIAPVSNAIPIPVFMAERFLHLPFVGLVTFAAAALAAAAPAPFRTPRVAVGSTAIAIVLLSFATWQRHQAWSSDEVLWKTTLADHPTAPGALHGYGSALIQQQRYAEGMSYLQQLLNQNTIEPGRRAVVLAELGSAYTALGQVDLATRSFENAIAAAPDPRAYLGLATAYITLGRLQDAEEQIHSALSGRPEYAEAHSALGAVRGRQGRQREAIAEWREALRLKPSLPSARANLGIALASEGRLDEGIDELLQAIALQPEQPTWRYMVARLYEKGGRTDLAILQLEAALRIDPGFSEARAALQAFTQK